MKTLIFIIIFLAKLQLNAQSISQESLVEDLAYLTESIKKYNPALDIYNPEFDSLSFSVINSVELDSYSIFDCYYKISQICALSNEGHFGIGTREDTLRQGILSDAFTTIPIQVRIFSDRLFIVADFSNEQVLAKGDEILTVNGMSSNSILKKLLDVTPSDGEIRSYAFRKIEGGFPSKYHYFIEQTETFELTILDEEGKERTANLRGLVLSEQIKNVEKYYGDRKKKSAADEDGFYTLDINDDYALLTLPSFDFRRVNKYEVKSKKMYEAIFRELRDKKVGNLVIDLRDNTGGRNEFADDMIPFILQVPTSDKHYKQTISWEGKVKKYKMPKASKYLFDGSIYVFVNGKTYSAGSSLARYLKEYGNATIIGTESGTRYEGFAAGSSHEINLPNTGLEIRIPRYHIDYPQSVKQKTRNRGLLPDHEIEGTIEAYLEERDLYVEVLKSLFNIY